MLLAAPHCTVRSWRESDLDRLVRLADNRAIWRNLRDRFPHPYTREAGQSWIRVATSQEPETNFVIAVDDDLVGSIGLTLFDDIARKNGELGYWIGEPYWGRGLVTEAMDVFVPWCFEHFDLIRIWAGVFAWNPASARALEKAGFRREAHFRKSGFKDGQAEDEYIYAMLREESDARRQAMARAST